MKYPIILPRGDWITKLILQHCHETGHHISGINTLAQRYWIIRGWEEVREYENQCYDCRRRKAKVTNQIMTPLLSVCLKKPLGAFVRTAVDYVRPFITIQSRGRKKSKRYLCFFTYLLPCAVHLEIAYGLDTRFIS